MSDRQTEAHNAAIAAKNYHTVQIARHKAALAQVLDDLAARRTDSYNVTAETRPYFNDGR